MAITSTEYSFTLLGDATHSTADMQSDAVGLSDGNYGVIGTNGSQIDLDIRTIGGGDFSFTTNLPGSDGAIAQLANGNIVITSTDAGGGVNCTILTSRGGFVSGDLNITGNRDDSNTDVAALSGGGFVIVNQRAFTQPDNDIQVSVRDASGAEVASFTVSTLNDNDQNPSVAGLADGGFAVAFDRIAADGSTDMWTAVYNADGTVRRAPAPVGTVGSIARDAGITALPSGGFALAYEDNGWDEVHTDVTYARFDSAGALIGFSRATSQSDNDGEASVTTLSNGLSLTTFTRDFLNSGDFDLRAMLFDPVTGAALTNIASPFIIDVDSSVTSDSSVSAVGLARFVVSFTNATDGNVELRSYQLVRTTTFDDADDAFAGDDAVDTIIGNGGNDTLNGLANDDTLNGGDGDDLLLGATGNDRLFGGNDGDTLFGGEDNDTLNGDGGSDTLLGGEGDDEMFGGNDNDRLTGGAGADRMFGGSNDDTFIVSGAETTGDTIDGGTGSDRIVVTDEAGADIRLDQTTVTGVEEIEFDASNSVETSVTILAAQVGAGIPLDLLIDGEGDFVNRFRVEMGAGTSVNLSGFTFEEFITSNGGDDRLIVLGDNDAESIVGTSIRDEIYGSGGNDTLGGGSGSDYLSGGSGTDTATYSTADSGVTASLIDAAGNIGDAAGDTYNSIENLTGSGFADQLTGNAGGNVIRAGAGNDTLVGLFGNDQLFGDGGDDLLEGGAGFDAMNGGTGTDTASYANATARVVASLANAGVNAGEATGDSYNSIENLSGSAFNDSLDGNNGANRLEGGSGDDTLRGFDGVDTLAGGENNDTLAGGLGGDVLNGGAGSDVASYADATTGVVVSLANAAINTGEAAGDSYVSIERIIGSNFDDNLNGANVVNNTLRGGAGNDTLKGYTGNDALEGGLGNDTFVFNTALNAATNVDTILDFTNQSGNDDRFLLDDAFFVGISGDPANDGRLLSGFYKNITTGAQDANDRILYRQSTGELIYDANGLQAGGQTVFAKVVAGTALSFQDFFVN